MTKKRVCFIGIGSIAKRHIRNMTEVCRQEGIDLSIDAVRRKPGLRENDLREMIDHVCTDPAELGYYDAVFITNPTSLHTETLKKVWGKGGAYFIEKPVSDLAHIESLEELALSNEKNCYVACPLRYTKAVRFISDYAKKHRVTGIRAMSSSFLPEWRPGQDYRQTYSADKELGGGVSIDLIHEWDYLRHIFGMPVRVSCMMGKKSGLEINSEDTAVYLAEYEDKFVELHLDYFGRKTLRECMIFSDEDTVLADLVSNKAHFLKSGKTLDFSETRDDYQREELRHFLKIMDGEPSDSTIAEGIQTLKLTQGIIDSIS